MIEKKNESSNCRVIDIQSPQNAFYRKLLKLKTSKGIHDSKEFLLSGRKLIDEYMTGYTNSTTPASNVSKSSILAEILSPYQEAPVSKASKVYRLPLALFKALDEVGTNHNLLVLKQPEIPPWRSEQEQKSGIFVLCPLGDPTNVGALIRSAEALGALGVILLKESAHPFLPKAVKASSGAVLRLPLYSGPSIKDLNQFESKLFALDRNGRPIQDFDWPPRAFLLVGEEGLGIPGNIPTSKRLSIPLTSGESLNAVVALSLALFLASIKE